MLARLIFDPQGRPAAFAFNIFMLAVSGSGLFGFDMTCKSAENRQEFIIFPPPGNSVAGKHPENKQDTQQRIDYIKYQTVQKQVYDGQHQPQYHYSSVQRVAAVTAVHKIPKP